MLAVTKNVGTLKIIDKKNIFPTLVNLRQPFLQRMHFGMRMCQDPYDFDNVFQDFTKTKTLSCEWNALLITSYPGTTKL